MATKGRMTSGTRSLRGGSLSATGALGSPFTPAPGSCDTQDTTAAAAASAAAAAAAGEAESACAPATTFAIHFEFQRALADHVHALQVKDKRAIFATMRKAPKVQPDSFLPGFGMTVGEFATFNVLAPGVRKPSGARRGGGTGTGTGTGVSTTSTSLAGTSAATKTTLSSMTATMTLLSPHEDLVP